MRVLFYGGCHAMALRRIFEQYVPGVEVDHITNYKLIRENVGFPYDHLKRFDWVVFNPILNKEAYNTVHLEAFAKANGVKTLKYPWLQWQGYYPTVRKISPDWYTGYWLSGLDAVAERSPTFDHFCEQVFHGQALADEARQQFEATTGYLQRLETHADLNVSDFVLRNYQTQRLFLTPDHPSLATYKHLVRLVSEALGCKVDPSFYWSAQEVQQGIQIPILPSVSRALGITFAAGDFQHNLVYGDDVFPLREFLKLHYFKDLVRVATAKQRTRLHSDPADPEAPRFVVPEGDRLLVFQVQPEQASGYREYGVITPLKADRRAKDMAGRNLHFYPGHCAFTTKIKAAAPEGEKVAVLA